MGLFNDKQTTEQTPATVGPKGDPGIGFKLESDGNYDMDQKKIFNLETQDDVPNDSDYETIKKDYKSVPNKEYLNNHFLKRNKNGVFYDLKGFSIRNSEVYDPNTWDNKTITNKEYVDLRDNLKADKTDLDKKADLTTNNEQTFKGIINVPNFDSGYSNLSNVMNKKYIDQKLDMKTTVLQTLKSRVQIPNYDASSSNESDVPNLKYLSDKYLNKEAGGQLQDSLLFNSFHTDRKKQIYHLGKPLYDSSATNKAYVDAGLQNKVDANKVVLLDGTQAMETNLNMGGYKIVNMRGPKFPSDCVNKKYLIDYVGESQIQSINYENKFKYIMTDPESQLSDEDGVELGNIVTYQNSPHQINKNVVDMKLLLDRSKGFYSSRFGVNLFLLSNSDYTVCLEIMWLNDKIDPNSISIDASSSIETIHNVNQKTFKTQKYVRLICQFTKGLNIGNNYLYIDMILKMNSGSSYDQKLQTYLIIYGIFGHQLNINPSIYDQIFYIKNNQIIFNSPITLQNQSISGVKDAKNNDEGVNYKQLNTLEATLLDKLGVFQPKSYYNTIFEYFFDLLDPSNFIMSDSLGAVVSGLGSNLVFQTTKLLKEFKPRDGFTGVFIVDLNENVTENDNWTIYIAFKYDYKSGDNKRIKIELGNDGSFDFPWVKLESGKLFLDYDLDVYSKQIRDAYIGEYLNLWYTKIAGQFRIAVCNNAMSIDQTFSGFNINASNIKITSDYFVQRIGFSMTAFPINNKEYHKIQFLDKTKSVFFE